MLKQLVSWALGRNFVAWHVVAGWESVPNHASTPRTACGVVVPPEARVCFREAAIRPAEICDKCWPVVTAQPATVAA